MNVSLNPELERYVREKVESGLYSSASEVIREALRLLLDQELLRQQHLDRLRQDIEIGLAEARQGKLVDGRKVRKDVDEALARKSRQGAKKRPSR
jgi:antitoxin ParD1/3/4